MRLKSMKVGDRAKIIGLSTQNQSYRQKLIALGLLPGTEFEVVQIAPLGDPVEILIRGFALSLRKHEADSLQLQEI